VSALLCSAALALPAAVAPAQADARPSPVRVGARAKAKPASDCKAPLRRTRAIWRACA
jgi:hypothetical protein